MSKSPEVVYSIRCEPEDQSVRGNFASGDDDQDRELEDQIIADLESGNDWAWCYVVVTASITVDEQTFTGTDTLGGCSYASESDFCQETGYWPDMKSAAYADLIDRLNGAAARGEIAARSIKSLSSTR